MVVERPLADPEKMCAEVNERLDYLFMRANALDAEQRHLPLRVESVGTPQEGSEHKMFDEI
ncbi:hypothetical protein ACP70R_050087 [Stipagrostis hirtigluma subsp. patula]